MSYSTDARGLRALARLLVLPLLGVGVGLGAAYVVTAEMTPTYRATASVVVLPKEQQRASSSDLTDVSLALNVSPSVARLAESREVADTVAERLRLPEDQVFGKVTAVSEPGNQIVTVQSEAESPGVAARIANEITRATTGVYNQLRLSGRSGVTVQALDVAAPPTTPVSPRPLLNYALGALVGLLVGVGIATLRTRSDDRFRAVRDLEKNLGLPTLGRLRSLPRWPRDVAKLYARRRIQTSVDATVATIAALTGDHRHCRVLVTSVGADRPTPMIAALLTQGLARHGHRAVVVDAQPRRRGLDRLVGAGSAVSVAAVLDPTEGAAARTITSAALRQHLDGRLDPDRVAAVIDPLAARTDALVITAPPVFSGRTLSTLAEHVDVVLLVVDSDRVGQPEATRAALLVRRLEVKLAGTLVIGTAVERDGTQPGAWRPQVDRVRHPRTERAPAPAAANDPVIMPVVTESVVGEPVVEEPVVEERAVQEPVIVPEPAALASPVKAVGNRRWFAKPVGRHVAPGAGRPNGWPADGHASDTGTVTPLNGAATDRLDDDDTYVIPPAADRARRSLPTPAEADDDPAVETCAPRRVRARAS